MSASRLLLIIILSALVTLSMRALPFIIFDPKRGIPPVITRLGDMLPKAVMATLVIYCLKSVSLSEGKASLELLAATFVVVVTHLIKRNTILSIFIGTVFYMIILKIF